MTKYSVVTTFNQNGFNVYANKFIKSFNDKVDNRIPLVVYAEDCQPTGDSRTLIFDAKQTLTKLNNFKLKWGNVPKANGKCPPEIKAKRPRDWHKEFKWDAIRFANKVYAIFHEAKRTDADILIWMDADSIVHSTVTQEDFERMLPSSNVLHYLGRGKKWPECGFYGLNLKTTECQNFLQQFERMYEEAEKGIFTLDEWHDSYVFDVVLKRHKQTFPQSAIKDFSGHLISGEGHPLINCELGAYFDHLKGDSRKAKGQSLSKDLKVKRVEPYWKTVS